MRDAHVYVDVRPLNLPVTRLQYHSCLDLVSAVWSCYKPLSRIHVLRFLQTILMQHLHISVYVYVSVHVHLYIYIHICHYIYILVYKYVYIYTCIHISIHTYLDGSSHGESQPPAPPGNDGSIAPAAGRGHGGSSLRRSRQSC